MECIIVPGYSWNGEELHPEHKKRIIHAVKLYLEKDNPYLIFSGTGGLGSKINDNLDKSFGETVRDYVLEFGIEGEHVLLEENSSRTIENLVYSWEIMKEEDLEEAVIVSSDYHIPRLKRLANHVFPDWVDLEYYKVEIDNPRMEQLEHAKTVRDLHWLHMEERLTK